jgi:hypothetical protein
VAFKCPSLTANNLQRSLAKVLEFESCLASDLLERTCRQTNPTGLALVLDAGGHIYTVSKDVVFVTDDVANVDADAKRNRPFPAAHFALNRHGAGHRIDCAGKFDQQAVACGLDEPTSVICDGRIDDLAANGLESFERADFVGAH